MKASNKYVMLEEPVVLIPLMKQSLAVLEEVDTELMSYFTQQDAKAPTLFFKQRLEIVSWRALVSSPRTHKQNKLKKIAKTQKSG